MTNPIQLLRDFLKWRKEKYRENLINLSFRFREPTIWNDIELALRDDDNKTEIWRKGVLFGIIHRKEILKQVKI